MVETLEQRQLLAVGPQLVGASPDDGENFVWGGSPNAVAGPNRLSIAPNELTFRFEGDQSLDPNTLASGIRITRSLDGRFDNDADGDGNIDDLRIEPGFIGFGDSQFEVVARFAETLPADVYRVQIFGFDDAAREITGLRDTQGDLFVAAGGGNQQTAYLDLQLGAQVISVVPQPVLRDPVTGALSQAKDQVQVYFNSDRLDSATATNPAFYRLIDTTDQSLLFPQSVSYDATARSATLTFAGDLSLGTYQLQIGTSEETNETLGTATNLGTVAQQAVAATFASSVQKDADGNPIPRAIPDQGSVISTISVLDSFFIADVNVELDIDHSWGPDLRVFLESPGGQRVELIRDVGSEVLGGQIYGVKFDDLDGDGVRGSDEPGLEGWTIFIDANNNSELDAGERSTVTDAEGRYAFVGLELSQTYRLGEVPQPRWQQTVPLSGGLQQLLRADFSDGSRQIVRFEGNPQSGTFRLGFDGRATAPIEFAGPTGVATTAANIETALAAILDPGIVADVTPVSGKPNEFAIAFALDGVATPAEHPVLQVVENLLNTGVLTVVTVGDAEGFTSSGPNNQWHVTASRGTNAGHTGLDSFYFGSGERPARGGTYVNNADGTLVSPEMDLGALSGELQLSFNHHLATRSGDFAEVRVLSEGTRTVLLRTSQSTGGFEAVELDLSAFAGKRIQLEFNFTSDGSATDEGWFVDDVSVGVVRGMRTVTLDATPQASVAKNVDFGSTRGTVVGPDQFGYEAFNVPQEFEDITDTGQQVLQQFNGSGYAFGIGGSGSDKATAMAADAAGNVYLAGSFQGTIDFDPGAGNTSLTSVGGDDIFVAKYSSDGELLWARRAGGAGADAAASVQLDASGNAYLTGSFSSTADFDPGAGTLNLTSAGATDAFIWKLDSQGTLVWARSTGGASIDAGTDVHMAPNGDIAVSGYFSGSVDFDPGAGQQNLTSGGGTDAFVTRFDAAGNLIWARRAGGAGNDRANSVIVDAAGNVTTTGAFSGTVDFDPGAAISNLNSAGSTDGFVQQLNAAGDFRWARSFGSSASDRGMAAAVGPAGDTLVTGVSNGDVYVLRLSAAGNTVWEDSYGGNSTDIGEAIAVDSAGDVYVAGSFRSTVNFGSGGRVSAGGSDVFLLRLTDDGSFDLVRTMGGELDDSAASVLPSGSSIYLAGEFRGTSTFVTGPADVELTSQGLNDGFLAKIVLPEGVDDQFVQLDPADLDGFEFDFYGQQYDGLFFNSNGLITFGAGNPSGANTDLVDLPSQASIAAFWEDLVTGGGEKDTVFWEVRGEGDDQRLIVQWNNVQLDNPVSKSVGPLNFQAVLRERDGSIQFNYRAVSGPLAERNGADRAVGTFRKGVQTQSAMAIDADGNYFVVWNSPGQDESGDGIYGRRFSAAGTPVGDEFRIGTTNSGNQSSPAIAMNAAGEAVVVWQGRGNGDTEGIFARRFNAAGAPVGEEMLVNATSLGVQVEPSVVIDDAGGFVVSWSGAGEQGDTDGVHARRFDANGQPLGVADEIQRLRFLGPPVNGASFTLIHRGIQTADIAYAGVNRGANTAANVQAALRALPTTGPDLVVIPVANADEVQTITFTGEPTTGSVQLEFAGQVTAPIDYAGADQGAATAANIETALRALTNTGDTLTVVPENGDSDTVFIVTFLGSDGRRDQPLLRLSNNALDQGSLDVVETVQGANQDTDFEVRFLGADGRRDQPLLVLGDRQGGVTHLEVVERQKGTSGEFQANTYASGAQRAPQIGIDADGNFVISWTSVGQDGDQAGIFGKRFDASGNALPGDQDELQRIVLEGPPVPGSRFSLRLGSRSTGAIDYAGPNRGSTTAANIETALRGLGPAYADVTVTAEAGLSNEVQRITFSAAPNNPNSGTFRLGHRGLITAPITYAGQGDANAATTAANIEAALRALANTGDTLTVVPAVLPNGDNDDRVFIVSFIGADGGVDHPPLVLSANQLNQGSLTVDTIDEGGKSDVRFLVHFTGAAGRQNHPLLELADNTRGVVAITAEELIQGADSEFQINQETLQLQDASSLARRDDGSFLVVWHSLGQDGDGAGIFAKLFAANGDVLRDEFQVNTFTESHQSRPTVGVDEDGNFVVAWRSLVQDDSIGGIYARRIGADGYAVEDEFQVHTLTAGDQTDPSIAVAADGQFVIGWTTPAGGGGIHAQRFAADGAPVGSEAQVSQFGTRDQANPVIARSANGNHVVVWIDQARDLDLSSGIYAQVFDANQNPLSGEFQVNQRSELAQTLPSVAIDDNGNFVVAWSSGQPGPDDTTVQSVRARRFGPTGTPLGSEFQVNQSQVQPTVWLDLAIDADSGEFVVVWDDASDASGSLGIRGRRYDAAGRAAGREFVVNTTVEGDQFAPRVARDPSGNFVVVWSGYSSGANSTGAQAKANNRGLSTHETIEVFAQRFAADGTRLGSEFRVNESTDLVQFPSDVATDGAGNFVVVWEDWEITTDIELRRFDRDGNPLSGDIRVNDATTGGSAFASPKVSVASDGSFVVVWHDNNNRDVLAQRFSAEGRLIGPNLVVNTSVVGIQSSPSVAAAAGGQFLVAWTDDAQGGTGVFTQAIRTGTSTVGIKDSGVQNVGENVLQISVGGVRTPLVGPNTSTRVAPETRVQDRVFAVDRSADRIQELDPKSGELVNSFPAPQPVGNDAGLAFAGGTLYFIAAGGNSLYELNPHNGAVVDVITVAGAAASSLAYLDGQLVVHDALAGELVFVDPAADTIVRRVNTAVPLGGALVGGGSRGTLFSLNAQSRIVELDPADGAVLQTLSTPAAGATGLALVNGALLVADRAGRLRRVDPDSGAVLSTVAISANLVALGGDGGGGVRQATGGNYQPFVDTVLDDEAELAITEGIGPYTGRFRPVEPLSTFDQTNVQGTWRLQVQDTQAGNVGVLHGWKLLFNERQDTPTDLTYMGYVGDNLASGSQPANDVDLYRFDVLKAGTITVNLAPIAGLDGVIRLFNAQGVAVATVDAADLGGNEELVHEALQAGTFYVGISSRGNVSYSATNGNGVSGGASTGSYELGIDFSEPLELDDDNSSFDTAVPLGVLGKAGQKIRAEIRNAPPATVMPGGLDEPGHRHIPPELHYLSGAAAPAAPDRLLLRFADGVGAERQAAILATHGLQVVRSFESIGVVAVKTASGSDVIAKVIDLEALDEVRYAEPDFIFQTQLTPNDARLGELWGMNNTGQTGGIAGADIDAVEAWDTFTGSGQTVVAVIDTGVDYTHPDLIANMWRNPGEVPGDGVDNDGNGYIDDIYGIDTANGDSDPFDGNGHGTHVAGTIAAEGNNGLGVSGVSWNSRIMALKFLSDAGPGTTTGAIEAIDYMTTMKTAYGINVVVSNNSWGGGGFSQALQDAISASIDAGILFVAAAGNEGTDNDALPSYPASYPLDGILAVSATDHNDRLAGFSQFGATSVDIAAPGVDILSTVPGGGYEMFSGTSMASPHVSGVAALLAGFDSAASPAEIKQAIMLGADPLPNLTGTSMSGGRLNAARALNVLGQDATGAPTSSITTAYYNFQDFYGTLPSGDTPGNAITENQKQRAREIFEIYGHYLGIQFAETANQGITVVTGDMRAVDPTVPVGPGGVAGISDGSLSGTVIMDAAENWGASEYGGGWFETAMHEIGHSLGLGHSYDLHNRTVQGGFGTGEPVFPGDHDLVHGRFLFPQASVDLDVYRFEVSEAGWLTAETIAERLNPNASLLDTALTLYRESSTASASRQVIARNDDFYSNDSYLRLHVEPGVYYVAVSSKGNSDFDPAISDSGFGGTTEGDYELSLRFEADPASSIVDTGGVPLDGDADGAPGGEFSFWFESGPTIFVDKAQDDTPGVDGDGSLDAPYDNLGTALEQARSTLVMPRSGATIRDGESFRIGDDTNAPVRFEFDSNGIVQPGAVAVPFTASDTAEELAAAVAAAINDLQLQTPVRLTSLATAIAGTVRIGNASLIDASGSASLLRSPSLVRVIGNGGSDGNVATLADNRPYLVGLDNGGAPLSDGASVEVPQGVTLMVDAGVLFKLQEANLDVGTSAQGVDRRGGALQVLGTPTAPVSFRSFRNDDVGGDSDGPSVGPQSGDWGGLVFRADSDREDAGIFLNWVNHASLINGGGKLLVGSVEETFTPVHLIGARPTITHNVITNSADAAISADPLSFEDSDGRVGPEIQGNLIVENSVNGLFVRIRTRAGEAIDRIDLPSRWDDTDIVHVLTENLLIASTPGGPLVDPASGVIRARLDGRLAIDPGVIVKVEGARIEVQLGAQLIAEGTAARPTVLTALTDDSFGGSGTFDTKNDGAGTAPAAGQWGGVMFNATSQGSLDHVLLAYAGGVTPIEGGFDRFNAVEIHQATVRITNSLLRDNAAGVAGTNRNGRGGNGSATVFVRGAQPVVINNVFRDNAGTAVNINANSLNAERRFDIGRQTGPIDVFAEFADNHGPLVRLNRLQNNGINGMEVRGAVLTTESVWDDTDIAHVLRGEIEVLNHHTFSGLSLQSNERESLVVKLSGADAGFTANGTPLDIDDRIGGSLYIVAAPGRPVVLTSLEDDSVAAGFDVNGQPQGDTDSNGTSAGSPGDWRSVLLDRYSNDRNVAYVRELEPAFSGPVDLNRIPSEAQFLGHLAPDEKSGDEIRRLGFEVRANISLDRPSDLDVYSFTGVAGSEVWFDIDRTGAALDTIVELIDANGMLLARSLDNRPESLSGLAVPLIKAVHLGDDFYTTNPHDAGMRVVLPGSAGTTSTYFVRVRSTPAEGRLDNLSGGLSRGQYQLQIRLRQVDEKPGSTIRGADIRYATNGIEVRGLPGHSPLIGETGESTANNNALGSAQPLGNLLTTDRNTISLGGSLSASTDVDWYSFTLDYDLIQAIGGVNDGAKTFSTIFDIDYADGLGRPDTVISVFDAAGNLVLVSRDSNVEDDQPGAGQGADTDDLSRGSFGTQDAFIGSVQMPAGVVPANTSRTYYVAVSSNSQLPTALNATFTASASNSLIRLEPVNSVQRIAEDHIGFSGYTSGDATIGGVPVRPTTSLFDIRTAQSLSTNVVPFTLNDVVLYLGRPGEEGLRTANPFTGELQTTVGNLPGNNTFARDFAMRSDGRLFMVEGISGPGNAGQNTAGRLVEIDPATGAQTVIGNDNIPDFNTNTNPPDPQQLTSTGSDALAFLRTGFDTGQNRPTYSLYYAVQGAVRSGALDSTSSTLYRANPDTGSAALAQGEPWGRRGEIYAANPGDLGRTTGMAFVGGTLYGVSDSGKFYQIDPGSGRASNVVSLGGSFSGLSAGPQNLENGRFADMLFASTSNGQLIALDTDGARQSVFAGGATSISTGFSAAGLAFSPLDFNLWHPTERRGKEAGHGINAAFDQSRNPSSFERFINGRDTDEGEGGASFQFGFEQWESDPFEAFAYFTYGAANAQYGMRTTEYHRDLSTNPRIGNNYNLPGGALGSLATQSVSLSGYDAADKPTLYFNYFLETENTNAAEGARMRDSARVLVSADGGTSWQLLATNNSVLSTADTLAELPRFISPSSNASNHPRQRVQELFDNTGGWRQARVDLSDFAGSSELMFRFDFSTAGTMDQGAQGDSYGDFLHRERGLNNNFEGFYVDDVIVGFAERGEMVTASNAQSQFFTVPQNPDPGAPSQVLVGDYQLELRRGTEYGATLSNIGPEIAVFQTFDTNNRMVGELRRLGDRNLHRDQGQLLIVGNTVSDSREFGIVVDAGLRDVNGNVPHPGSVRNLPTINNQRLVTGVNIENNVVANLGTGGILYSGDPNSGTQPLAAVSFGRILNNTIYGGATPVGAAIRVSENASPTILNNIIANTASGVSIDGTSSTTVVGANLFQGNTNNGTVGSNALLLAASGALFVDAANGNFYLAPGSDAIDSSLNSLADRPGYVAVKSPLGIPASPILAPDRDRFAQLRLDDPSQDPPPGLGSNIFKDRGAIERADFVGPVARLVAPLDNDGLGRDLDPAVNAVLVDELILSQIVIQLSDVGIGIDDTSVTSANVSVTLDGVTLNPGTDYQFTYNRTNKLIILSSLANNGLVRSRYVVTLENDEETGIRDSARNALRSNRPSGETTFTLVTGGLNVPPVAVDDLASGLEDTPLRIDLAGNDYDPKGVLDLTSVTITGDPASGSVTVNDDGTVDYIPALNFYGTDTFTYTIRDTEGLESNEALVTVEVAPVINDPPEFTGIPAIDALEDGGRIAIQYATGIRPGPEGDSEEADQTVRFVVTADASNPAGLIPTLPTITANGVLRFDTAADAVGTASFIITLVDDGGTSKPMDRDTSEPQTLTINVRPVNDAPLVTANAPAVYRMREDNAPDGGGILIPLRGSAGGPAGLLDQFSVGPANEVAGGPGGSQSLSIVNQDFPITTTGRGRVEAVTGASGSITALRYFPAADFNNDADGSFDSFFYTVTDDGVSFDPSTGNLEADPRTAEFSVNIVVEAVNDAPTFTAALSSVTRLEDSGASQIADFATGISAGPLSADDENDLADGQNVTFEVAPAPGFTAADIAALFAVAPRVTSDGTLSFTPAANAVGTVELLVSAVDDGPVNASRGDENRSQPATVTITIAPVNDPPIADPSVIFAELDEDSSIDLPVTASDGSGLFDVFQVGPDNEADGTQGGNQTLTTNEFLFSSATAGGGRVEAIMSGGQLVGLRYTPAADFSGTDAFVYGVIDDGQTFDPSRGRLIDDFREAYATVSLTVNPVNDRPQFAGAADVSVSEDVGSDAGVPADEVGRTTIDDWLTSLLAGPATADDENNGPDAQTLTFEITFSSGTDPNGLFAELPSVDPANGQLRFRTAPDASGQTTFQIVAVDDGPRGFVAGDPTRPEHQFRSLPQTFTIEVTAVNDPPRFTAGGPITVVEGSGPFNGLWATNVTPGPADEVASGQAVAFDVVVAEADRAKFISQPTLSDGGLLQFTPAEDASGEIEILITARDTDGAAVPEPHTLTLTITPVNDTPVASGDSLETAEDTVLVVSADVLLSNDDDVDLPDDLLAVADLATTSLMGAAVTISTDGSTVTYDPTGADDVQALREGETATDLFTYRVVDAAGATSSLATVTVTVTGSNDAPTARPDQFSVHPSQPTILKPLANDTDADGTIDPGSIVITVQPTSGSIRLNSDGTLTYTPSQNPDDTDRIRYAVRDDQGVLSEAVDIELLVNPPPTAQADIAVTYRNESIDIDVLSNDSDDNGSIDPATVQILSAPRNGQASVNDDGTVSYQPAIDFFGNDSFTYRVSDDQGTASEAVKVDIRVIASRLQNPGNPLDVDASNQVSPIDALLVVNYLNRRGQNDPSQPTSGPPYYDVDGNGRIAPLDALRVINALNRSTSFAGEGESARGFDSASRFATSASASSRAAGEEAGPQAIEGETTMVRLEQAFDSLGDIRRDSLDELLDDLTKPRDDSGEETTSALDALWSNFTGLE